MGLGTWFAKLGGKAAGEMLASPIDAIRKTIDDLHFSGEEKSQAEIIMTQLAMKPQLLQGNLNMVEAQHRSRFVAGWRPALGWVLAISLGMYYIPQFAMASIIWVKACLIVLQNIPKDGAINLPTYPISDIKGLMELILGMLGLAGFRTFEKLTGRTK
jgi:hypothetical protein